MRALLLLPTAILLLCAVAAAQVPTHISPARAAGGPGNINNTIPFVSPNGVHYQQVHSANGWSQTGGVINRLRSRKVQGTTTYTGGMADIEVFMAQSPNDAANASNVFANNVVPGRETNVFTRKTHKLPDLMDTSWAAGDFMFDVPFPWAPNTHLSWRCVIYSNTTTSYTLDCWSDWRNGASSAYTGCTHANATMTALHNATFRSPGNVSDFLGYPRITLVPNMPAILLLGTSASQWGPITLPFDMTVMGAPGCQLVNSGTLLIPTAWTSSTFVQVNITFPADPGLVAGVYYSQFIFFEPTANALGAWTTNGRINGPIPPPVEIARIYAVGTPGATQGTLGLEFAIPIGLN